MIVHVALILLSFLTGWWLGLEGRKEAMKAGWDMGWDSAVRTAQEKAGNKS